MEITIECAIFLALGQFWRSRCVTSLKPDKVFREIISVGHSRTEIRQFSPKTPRIPPFNTTHVQLRENNLDFVSLDAIRSIALINHERTLI